MCVCAYAYSRCLGGQQTSSVGCEVRTNYGVVRPTACLPGFNDPLTLIRFFCSKIVHSFLPPAPTPPPFFFCERACSAVSATPMRNRMVGATCSEMWSGKPRGPSHGASAKTTLCSSANARMRRRTDTQDGRTGRTPHRPHTRALSKSIPTPSKPAQHNTIFTVQLRETQIPNQ